MGPDVIVVHISNLIQTLTAANHTQYHHKNAKHKQIGPLQENQNVALSEHLHTESKHKHSP
jgi:hypothetical protein